MKNRFCRIGKSLLGAVCLLSTCGVTYSCSDDFDLDETKPSFLGASIYDELKNRTDRKFTTVINLIDDLDYKDVLSKTGSRTMFVADDDAFAEFFRTTTWTDGTGQPVRGYNQLSTSQKRLLLNGSMLNNAYVLEMMTTIQGPVKNLCLRQLSGIAATDSVPYFRWDELPENLNKEVETADGTSVLFDKHFWDKYRTQSRGGIYMALDKTEPLLTHFLQAQLDEKKIQPSDISFILGLDGTDKEWNDDKNRSFIYDREVVEPDVTCLNGYYNVLDGVLVTPPNMAEMIRQNSSEDLDENERTKFFSQILERFSAPYYDATLTEEYKALHSISADSVYQKLYISLRNQTGSAITRDPDGEPLGTYPSLSYDPGWNAYAVNNSTKEQDMGAIFAPSDAAIKSFFLSGGGASMIENYSDRDNTEDNLEYNLYQIPLNIMQALVANLMKESFNETVPSKYRTIMNSAQDQMFSSTDYPTVEAYKASIQKVMLANNGVVYVLKNFVSPPDYAAVSSPVLTDRRTQVMNTVIQADREFTASSGDKIFSNAPLQKFYSTYLLAMQANFTLFVPEDAGLRDHGYVDPISFVNPSSSTNFRYWTLVPGDVGSGTGKVIGVTATPYTYFPREDLDPSNPRHSYSVAATPSLASQSLESGYGQLKKLMLCDMVDHHILVHNDSEAAGVDGSKNYYVSRSGAPVYIKQPGTDAEGTGMIVDGAFQLSVNSDATPDNDFDCKVTEGFDLTRETRGYGNGHTYFLDRPMQATTNNVYQVLENNSEYSRFFELCRMFDGGENALMETIFKGDDMNDTQWNTERLKYMMFAMNGDASSSSSSGVRPTANGTNLIRFFNNYRYTIFVPSNDAIDDAIERDNLPTIEEIQAFVDENLVDGKLEDEARVKAQAMVTCLMNFLKYHFCDESFFVDKYEDSGFTESQSASSNDEGVFIKVNVKHMPNSLIVSDQTGKEHSVQSPVNQFARDYELDNAGTAARTIKSSSYVVLHGLGDYLLFDANLEGDFSKAWETPEEAKAFVKKFRLKK